MLFCKGVVAYSPGPVDMMKEKENFEFKPVKYYLKIDLVPHSTCVETLGKWIYVFIYPTPPPQVGCDTRSIFKQEYNWFEFRVFLLQDWLPNQDKKS